MLFLLLKFAYVFVLAFVYGHAIQQLLLKKREEAPSYFSLTALTGLFGLSVIGAFLSLVMPLAALAQGIILAGALVLALVQQKSLTAAMQQHKQQIKDTTLFVKALFIIAVIYVSYLSSLQSFTYDEGLYYAQFIKWIQAYKVVPGLANLHIRFGFNSHWHIVAALFNFSWLNDSVDNHINGALYLLTVLYMLPRREDTSFIMLLKAGLLIMINMPQICVYNIIAPAADLPIFYIGCLIILVWLQNTNLNTEQGVFLILAPLFLVTVKVSAVPVLLLSLLLFIRMLKNRQGLTMIAAGILFLGPWVIRNIILTGYPLFPMQLPDLFHTGWEVPLSAIHNVQEQITSFAFYRFSDIQHLHSDSLIQRYKTWFLEHLRHYDQVLILIVLLSPIVVYIRRRYLPQNFLPMYAFLILGLLFWLVQAPDPRFGYSFTAPLFVITVMLCFPAAQAHRMAAISLVVAFFFQAGTLYLYKHLHQTFVQEGMVVENTSSTLVIPAPYSTPPSGTQSTPSLIANMPLKTELCWDNPLPCVTTMPQNVTMRGATLADGFKAIK
jgi:hypothetical protein